MNFEVYADGVFLRTGAELRCALGRSGVIEAAAKREGDGATPAGRWPFRRVLYRPDRLRAPETRLAVTPLDPRNGWCDAPGDLAYNQPVTLPYAASAEQLWRDDPLYDLIVVLGHNDAPVVAGRGSAIFLHVARPDYAPTEGCVALAQPDLLAVLADAGPGDALCIRFAPRCR